MNQHACFWHSMYLFLFFFKKKVYYLFIWERERKHWAVEGGGTEGEGEADFPLSKESNVGLDPRTLRSQPELKADA